jgi:hypothetical protein
MTKEISTTDTVADAVLEYFRDPSVSITFDQDPEAIRSRLDAQVLNAESAEELFGGSEVIAAKQFLNKPFGLLSVDFLPSDIEGEGLPFYAILQIVDGNGERHTLSCGARSVVQKAAVAQANGWLPRWLKITEGKQTAAGYKPLDLVAAPSPEEF